MDDKQIIELYEARSEQAIEQTRLKYGAYLSTIARNILGSPQDSEESVQDACFKIWQAIPPAKPLCFRAFIGRIARNDALDKYAAKNSRKRGGGEYALALDEMAECLSDDAAASPSEVLELGELTGVIDAFLGEQKSETRRIFVLRYWYFCSVSEIAERLGVSESKVKTSLSRTRSGLKEQLSKEGYAI